MLIYVVYKFKTIEDRNHFYEDIKTNKIEELSRKDPGCMDYTYTMDGLYVNLREEWLSLEDQQSHLKTSHMDILKSLKAQYNCETIIRHGTVQLQTERLLLRKFTLEDAPFMYKNWANDQRVCRFLTWPVHKSVEVTQSVLSNWISQYDQGDFYQWIIVLKDSKEPIGNISVTKVDKKTNTVEVGYCIGYNYWGYGYVAEALKEVISYLFNEGYDLIRARHDINNPRSGKVMKKAGMVYEGTLRKYGTNNQGVVDTVFYSIMPDEI